MMSPLARPFSELVPAPFNEATGNHPETHGTTVLALRYKDGILIFADRRATMSPNRQWMAVAEPVDGRRTRLELVQVDAAGRTDPRGSILLPPFAAPLTALGLVPGATKETLPRIVVGSADGAMLLVAIVAGAEESAVGESAVERRWRAAAAKVTALAASADGAPFPSPRPTDGPCCPKTQSPAPQSATTRPTLRRWPNGSSTCSSPAAHRN
jgi:hypothetical protein